MDAREYGRTRPSLARNARRRKPLPSAVIDSSGTSAMPATQSRVLRHVVLFAFKSDAQAAQVVAGFAALPELIPGIQSYECGTNVSPEGLNDGFTHCFTLTFASDEARDAYLEHPEHQRFVGTLGECLERSLVIDYWAS